MIKATTNGGEWLRQSLGEGEHSPLKVDDFELRQALRQMRLDISSEIDPAKRKRLIAKYEAETVTDKTFERLAGDPQVKEFRKLLGSAEESLLYAPGGALEKPSRIRGALLEILSGVERDLYATYAAKELVANVPKSERKLALSQIDAALASFDQAMRRLPPSTANRVAAGTFNEGSARSLRDVLELAAARLRQPAIAESLDSLAELGNRPFRYATHADVGVDKDAFKSIVESARSAIKSTAVKAAFDIQKLWSATKHFIGQSVNIHDPDGAFAKLRYAGDESEKAFQAEVARLEKMLGESRSFKPGTERPAS